MGPVLGVIAVSRGVRAGEEHLCTRFHHLVALHKALCAIVRVHMFDGRGVNHEICEIRRDDLGHLSHVAELPANLERIIGCKVFRVQILCGCTPHGLLDVCLADVHAGVGCDILCVVAQKRKHQRAAAADIQHVHALLGHVCGRKVLDVVHHVQIGEETVSELHIKIPHLVGGAENLFSVHTVLDAVHDVFIHAIFLSYQGISDI